MAKVAIVALYHETNTFAPEPTEAAAFRDKGWYEGDLLLEAYRGTGTVIGGFLDGLVERGHTARGVFGAFATPSGTVTRAAFAAIESEIVAGFDRLGGAFDAVLVELHGAMVVDGIDDPEARVCRRLAEVAQSRPVVAAVDLHATMTSERLRLLHQLVGYRTNPHVDTWETGRDAARHLDRLLGGAPRPTVAFAHVPILMPAIAQATAELPLLRVLAAAREHERSKDLLDITVTAGYAYADVPHAGLGVTVSGPVASAVACDAARSVAEVAWSHREELRVPLLDPGSALRSALELPGNGPAIVADTGDNINGGAPGDETTLVHLVCERHPGVRVLGTYAHTGLAAAAHRAGSDAEIALPDELARALGSTHGRVRVVSDGQFVNRGPMAHGARISMGPSAVVEVGNVHLVVQGMPVQPNDPAMFSSLGLDPGDHDLLLLKGAAALAAGWSPLVRGIVPAATPGVTDSDLSRLAYRRIPDGMWPLGEASEPIRVEPIHAEPIQR